MDILRTLETQLVARRDKAAFNMNCVMANPTMENGLEKAEILIKEFSSCVEQLRVIGELIHSNTGEPRKDEV
jgi:hypothetical protein